MFNFPGQSQIIIIILFKTGFHISQVGLKRALLAKEKPDFLILLPLPQMLGLQTCYSMPDLFCASNDISHLD